MRLFSLDSSGCLAKAFGLLSIVFLFQACAGTPTFERLVNQDAVNDDIQERTTEPQVLNQPPTDVPPDNPICDPFNQAASAQSSGSRNGLLAKLSYLLSSEPIASSVYDFWDVNDLNELIPINSIEGEIFTSLVDVPTRRFEAGFFTQNNSSDAIRTSTGEILVENFGLRFESNLILGNAEAGEYEIAILSDDGAVLTLKEATLAQEDFVLDSDGTHATKMACSAQSITLDSSSQIPLELFYHQGPRYHIALILMWRKLGEGEPAGQDALCGTSGNSVFFDFDQVPSAPKQAYLDLLSRGWEVIPSTSFLLPGDIINPCVQ